MTGLRIGLVAGESSGDLLGAALIARLREQVPDAEFVGVGGPRMRAAGCDSFADAEQLAVMGLFEVLVHLPRLCGYAAVLSAISQIIHPMFLLVSMPRILTSGSSDSSSASVSPRCTG